MTREESWQAEGMTLALLQRITNLGYTLNLHRIPSSLLGRIGALAAN
jgi:hypothetical protein